LKNMKSKRKKSKKNLNIYDKYRQTLGMPNLTKEEIDKMRYHISLIAQAVAEHVWGKKFY